MGVAPGKRVEHGGDLWAIRQRFPNAPEPWLDLSTGINPVPYPVPDLPAQAWARLPTRQQEAALLAAATRRYGVRAVSTIVPAPGTQARRPRGGRPTAWRRRPTRGRSST